MTSVEKSCLGFSISVNERHGSEQVERIPDDAINVYDEKDGHRDARSPEPFDDLPVTWMGFGENGANGGTKTP